MAALILAVGVLHGLVGWSLADALVGWGEAARMPQRLQVAFVRELLPVAPPAPVAAAEVSPRPRRSSTRAARAAPAPAMPASQATAAEPPATATEAATEAAAASAAELPPTPAAPEPAATPDGAATAAADAAASAAPPAQAASAVAAAASSPGAPAFDWPASTRLSYDFVGNYRGEVRGSAQVEWVRSGDRYQVHLDVIGGLSFAPLFTRRMSSDGLITAAGLAPLRYDEDSKRAFGTPRHVSLLFEGSEIQLANGQRRWRPPGVQDTASQFVQLVWMFTLQPGLLQAGRTIEMPLALARSVDTWIYDVIGAETLYTPFGALESVHVKPRRVAQASGDMTVEIWFVPSLQVLPARIRIHQDAATFIDLMLARPPLQADPPATAASR